MNASESAIVLLRSTALCTALIMGSYARTKSFTDEVTRSG